MGITPSLAKGRRDAARAGIRTRPKISDTPQRDCAGLAPGFPPGAPATTAGSRAGSYELVNTPDYSSLARNRTDVLCMSPAARNPGARQTRFALILVTCVAVGLTEAAMLSQALTHRPIPAHAAPLVRS